MQTRLLIGFRLIFSILIYVSKLFKQFLKVLIYYNIIFSEIFFCLLINIISFQGKFLS